MTLQAMVQSMTRRPSPATPPRTKLDMSVAISVALMLAMVALVAFGDLGPAPAYAAVPM